MEVSNGKAVWSGVLYIGPIVWSNLLSIYINDLAEGVTSKILKLADDTELL